MELKLTFNINHNYDMELVNDFNHKLIELELDSGLVGFGCSNKLVVLFCDLKNIDDVISILQKFKRIKNEY